MEDDKACTLGLSLGLGIGGGYVPKKEKQKVHKPVTCLDLKFELYPKGEAIDVNHDDHEAKGSNLKRINGEEHQDPNSMSTDNTNNKDGSRKKLRLTKKQSALLEDSFKLHNTLSPAQKQALAGNLNLKHRKVEVWFQNRRARTKLKQREVDCEFLKKCCDKLTDENLRLKKELQELRALKVNLSKVATMTTCSSCKELLKPNEGNNSHKLMKDFGISVSNIST